MDSGNVFIVANEAGLHGTVIWYWVRPKMYHWAAPGLTETRVTSLLIQQSIVLQVPNWLFQEYTRTIVCGREVPAPKAYLSTLGERSLESTMSSVSRFPGFCRLCLACKEKVVWSGVPRFAFRLDCIFNSATVCFYSAFKSRIKDSFEKQVFYVPEIILRSIRELKCLVNCWKLIQSKLTFAQC